MRCPHCGSLEDKVIDSRSLAHGDATRRRRECISCGLRFTSYERIEDKPLLIIKRDGRREPFERSKLERGLQRALEKRPISSSTIENLINEIEDEAAEIGKSGNELASNKLGELVLSHLAHLDLVAYLRFASVYRQFDSLDAFLREVTRLDQLPHPLKPNRKKVTKDDNPQESSLL